MIAKYLFYGAYGYLALMGVMHFVVDVLSQHLRGKRTPSTETTLYYGLHTSFALGQVMFGLLGLWLTWRSLGLVAEAPALTISIAASFGWLAIVFLFNDYTPPRIHAAVYCVLILAAALTSHLM